jgi:uncharacterized SAM-binding protein YcdF (DUF218 family)
MSTPVVGDYLIWSVEALAGAIPILPSEAPPGAIVVLSADYRRSGIPGEPDKVGPVTLERLVAAARQERSLGLPVLVSGGRVGDVDAPLAELMSSALRDDFQVPVRWREDASTTTYENAAFSAEVLRRAGVPSALLVTHPWHMARALWSFHAVGYPVVPASRDVGELPLLTASSFFPQVPALLSSYYALHELIGLGWYLFR